MSATIFEQTMFDQGLTSLPEAHATHEEYLRERGYYAWLDDVNLRWLNRSSTRPVPKQRRSVPVKRNKRR